MPALAVVGADRQIIRSTETFRLKYASSVALCEASPELDLVLTGQTDNAVLDLGDVSLAIEAVIDAAGKRQAMLSLPAEDLAPDSDGPVAALREAADESAAIVWAKDLEGRYLYANASYERELGTSQERLLGNTDVALPAVETVDGPRLRYTEDGLREPLQLEYNVPALDGRPPLVAFRFALRNSQGQPVATCGVAAPSATSDVARDEAVRLMQLERWNRLDPLDVRAELLEQWRVQATPGSAGDVHPTEPPAAESVADAAEPVASARAAEIDELHEATVRVEAVEAEPKAAARLADEESTRLRADLEEVRVELEREKSRTRAARSEAEAARREAEAAQREVEAARHELGSARAEAESLRAPASAAVRLSEELERALAAERERGDELTRTLGRIRARLGDLGAAVDRGQAGPQVR